jgi:LacI family transcriptional regulator
LNSALKIAYLSPFWTTWMHRVVAGALRYADAHPPIVIRCFAPANNLTTAVADLEKWGADGILSCLKNDELETLLATLKRSIPIVNHAMTKEHPAVQRLSFSFEDAARIAVDHFRQLGLRSVALLVTEEGGDAHSLLVGPFLRIAKLPSPSRATLIFSADREKILEQFAPASPVPDVLADWLHSLPKPTGVYCPAHGAGGYLIRCCQSLGLRVPEDIAVIGTDDMDLSLASDPTLTSIVLSNEMLGFEATRLLQEWISGKKPQISVVRLHRMELQVRGSTGLRKPEICDIAGALKCIEENACRGITVEQLIKQTQSVSMPTFHRRFREVVGKSPAEAIRDRKLDEVRRLLVSTDLPMTMVSDLAGFSSAMVLARIFRAIVGVSLSDYRKKHKLHPPLNGKKTHQP